MGGEMDFSGLNINPVVSQVSNRRALKKLEEENDDEVEELDESEIFDLIRDIRDPEHEDLSLEQLNVLALKNVKVNLEEPSVHIFFTPTVPHCSASTLIGLCIRVKLQRSLPSHFKIDVQITPGGGPLPLPLSRTPKP